MLQLLTCIKLPPVHFQTFILCNFEWQLKTGLTISSAATWENRIFAYAKTKPQISCAVTAQLISAFVFATWIVQSLYFLNPKFRASSHLLWFPSPVCVGPGRKPRRPVFWRRGSVDVLPPGPGGDGVGVGGAGVGVGAAIVLYDILKPVPCTLSSVLNMRYSESPVEVMSAGRSVPQYVAISGELELYPSLICWWNIKKYRSMCYINRKPAFWMCKKQRRRSAAR